VAANQPLHPAAAAVRFFGVYVSPAAAAGELIVRPQTAAPPVVAPAIRSVFLFDGFSEGCTVVLYRPVGVKELELIAASGFRAFPPRLAWQPIFYPVLNRAYAATIARDWNTKDAASGYAGFVTEFEVEDGYASQFRVQQVGAALYRELWVPAEELAEFNRHINGLIRVVESYYGESFAGVVEHSSGLPVSVVEVRSEPAAADVTMNVKPRLTDDGTV
jgi:hypothetical protein